CWNNRKRCLYDLKKWEYNKSSGLHNDLIAHFEENGNYKNEGKVNGRIVVLSMLSFKFVNSGIINDVKYGLPFLIGTE
ncbi:hypothetical protein, partial [Streptobacillus moniliformis]|uniref:hypothetical protein n=1 Tax=Streptobacillus moniliformis TaxID=34105 RepID=UPI000A580B80